MFQLCVGKDLCQNDMTITDITAIKAHWACTHLKDCPMMVLRVQVQPAAEWRAAAPSLLSFMIVMSNSFLLFCVTSQCFQSYKLFCRPNSLEFPA